MQSIDEHGLGSEELHNSLERTIAILDEAYNISIESQIFAFEQYWSWAYRTGAENSEGIWLMKKVNNKLVGLEISGWEVPSYEQALDYLKENNIERVFSLEIPLDGYLGFEGIYTDEDDDIMEYKPIGWSTKDMFADNSIEVVIIEP